jgi:hypothetical protein
VGEKWSKLGGSLWEESVPVAGTPAEAYLCGRGISLLPGPAILRFHLAAEHPKLKRKLPALIAKVTAGAEPSHNCTWLAADGSGKANIEKAEQRRTFGSSKGGAVRFAEPIDSKPVIVGEGIETTATAMEATGLPGWASLGTSGLGNIEWPGDVREVILLAENDENGANQRALEKVCPVLAEQGLKVRAPRQRCATQASGSIGRPPTAKRKSSRSRRPSPRVGGKNRPHRPRHPTNLTTSTI